LEMTANAVRYANVDATIRASLMEKVDDYRAHMRDGHVPDTTPFGYRRAFNTI
jgi:hypothetical protein